MSPLVMSPSNARKRPTSGMSPVIPASPMPMQTFTPSPPDEATRWHGGLDGQKYMEPAARSMSSYALMSPPAQYAQGTVAPSKALARRPMHPALVASGNRNFESWNTFGDESAIRMLQEELPTPNIVGEEQDSIDLLEEMAQRAKREAQAKRKQIPPFVQKLSSFLDESRNTDLIRWSEKGDSFVVIDEDEFAKTLIPELFKHNNYASFVRQLNMYGFHKRVGLSDNSMKASERKNKSPSEYSHPYFRRGHPNLLWLITKPKSGGNKKKGKRDEADGESDEDGVEEIQSHHGPTNGQNGRAPVPSNTEVLPLPRKDYQLIKSQLDKIQQQQLQISGVLSKVCKEHADLYQQAITFQNMHERHETSINAILQFLANVYRKSLEEQGGSQTVQELLTSILPGGTSHGQMPQGSVVDLGDFFSQQAEELRSANPPKRAQKLLPPVTQAQQRAELARTASQSTASPVGHAIGSVTELLDSTPVDTPSPTFIKDELRNNPQEGMMRLIQGANEAGKNTSGVNLPNLTAASPVTMDDDQRNKMLNLMATAQASAPPPNMVRTVPVCSPSMPAGGLIDMAPSPILASVTPPNPCHLQLSQQELENIQKLQDSQSSEICEISQLLGPLSPSGIAGLGENDGLGNNYFDSVDLGQFVDLDHNFDGAFGAGANLTLDGTEFSNFLLDGTSEYATDPVVLGLGPSNRPGTPISATPSTSSAVDVGRNDLEMSERDPKRQRRV